MRPVGRLAEKVRADRHPVAADNPFLAWKDGVRSGSSPTWRFSPRCARRGRKRRSSTFTARPCCRRLVGLKRRASDAARRGIDSDPARRRDAPPKLEAIWTAAASSRRRCARCFMSLRERGADERPVQRARGAAECAPPKTSACRLSRASRQSCAAGCAAAARRRVGRSPRSRKCCPHDPGSARRALAGDPRRHLGGAASPIQARCRRVRTVRAACFGGAAGAKPNPARPKRA